MINKELMAAIRAKKKTVTVQAIYDAVSRVRESHGNAISKEEAAYLYASNLGVDIHKFMKNAPEILDRVTALITLPQGTRQIKPTKKQTSATVTKVLSIKGVTVDDPLLPAKIHENARQMAEVYPLIYMFENSVRNFIRLALNKAFPSGWWNEQRMTTNVYRNAENRKSEEGKNLWHGSRSSNMLDYIDLDELENVLSKNTETFTPYFKGLPKDLEWLKVKIKEIYPSRNVIAHCNPLSKHDIRRVEVICGDWQKQLPALKSKLEE
jgi:hypothetical protein